MKHISYLILAVALFASACGKKTTTTTEQLIELKKQRAELDQQIAKLETEVNKNDSTKATSVAVTVIQSESFNSFVEVQAAIEGDANVNVLPQNMAPAAVRSVLVTPGQRVGKGQTLAVLDASTTDQQIQAADAQLNLARQLYEKQQKLWAQNIGTQVQLLQAKASYESSLNNKQALVAMRNQYKVVSPISGVVDQVNLKVGDIASANSGAANMGIRVVSNDKLKALASLGENYIGKVHQGDVVTLVFPDLNDSIRTKVSYVSQAIDPISRAFNVEVKLPANKRLRPNMSCKMRIANYENNNALVIPVAAIQKTADGELVYVAENNKAKAVYIQTGRNSNGMVEVLGGLKAGDKVITAGFEDLDNGERIAVH
ncbi:MAG: efflux RND transporter periplasmic adaptor subunit [Sphingobacteriales bacterium]|nr:MAG: efflux RND transporter periplasmic adaptor subunit [Sphingobacteriales bacterium]